jgi:hypothetical protein
MKCLGERFQDAFMRAWGQDRIVPYAQLPAWSRAKWDWAAVEFLAANPTPLPNPALNQSEGE